MSEDLEAILWRLTKTVRGCGEREDVEFKMLVMARREARKGVARIFGGRILDLPEMVESRDSSQAAIDSIGKNA